LGRNCVMPQIRFVTSLGCTPCLRIKRILGELRAVMPNLTVEEVEFTSPVGTKLAMENGILYPPAVFLNGVMIAKGKIDANAMVMEIRKSNEIGS
jgi:hypothetical protein